MIKKSWTISLKKIFFFLSKKVQLKLIFFMIQRSWNVFKKIIFFFINESSTLRWSKKIIFIWFNEKFKFRWTRKNNFFFCQLCWQIKIFFFLVQKTKKKFLYLKTWNFVQRNNLFFLETKRVVIFFSKKNFFVKKVD